LREGGGQNQTIPTPPEQEEDKVIPEDQIKYCPQDASFAQFTCETGKSREQLCSERPEIPGCEPLPPPEDQPPIAVPTPCNPNTQSCPPAGDLCEEDPTAEGCEDLEPIEDPDDGDGGDGDEGGDGGGDGDDGGDEGEAGG
jgi:hypothetical protein